MDKLISICKFLLTDQGVGATFTNIVHIPHVRHYVDYETNDVITGEKLFSMIDVYHDNRFEKFKPLFFPENCYSLLNVYTRVQAIIGLRYHSFIFAEMANLPLLGLVAGPKAIAYANECNRKDAVFIDIGAPIVEILKTVHKFIKIVKNFEPDYANQDMQDFIDKLNSGGSIS
jgi:hypothetical protein